MRRRRGGRISLDPLLLAVFVAAFVTALMPIAESMQSTTQAREVISSMSSSIDETYDENRMRVLSQAQRYNAALTGSSFSSSEHLGGCNADAGDILQIASFTESEQPLPYDEQLRWRDNEAMCWLEIPRLMLKEPVYHGTSDESLAMGVGHLEWSSLPVGGSSSHCVLAAHTGMQRTTMFDDLDKLCEGDVFIVHTLGDAYQYRVVSIETVLPDEAQQSCVIVPEEDLCTLITCTPYGINTHRLLVHGKRVPFTIQADSNSPEVTRIPDTRRTLPMMLLIAGCITPLIGRLLTRIVQRIKSRHVNHMIWRNL